MCGRYTQTADLETLQQRFNFSARGIKLEPRYNLVPTQDAPVVIEEGESGVHPIFGTIS